MPEEYVPKADAETMLTVLNTMDNGVYELLLKRYGGAGLVTGNKYRYAVASWYLGNVAANPSYYTSHNQVNAQPETGSVGSVLLTCECGVVTRVSTGDAPRFGEAEWVVFHQIDNAFQTFPPKDRPQWFNHQ